MNSRESNSVGKVSFYAGDDEFLFFTPAATNPSLRTLEGSMWFEKTGVNGNLVFRSSSSVESLEWLRQNIGPLTLTREVYNWYQTSSSITRLKGLGNSPLLDYQKEAVEFLVSRSKAMLSLSPGLGKTITSIFAADQIGASRILVVAPLSLLYMWKSELEKWSKYLKKCPTIYIWHSIFPSDLKTDTSKFLWAIANPETIVKNSSNIINSGKFDLLILDESILYKNRNAQRTKKIEELSRLAKTTWLLTGAPATRMLDDLWSQFHVLKPKTYSSYWRFAKEYCVVEETPWGTKVTANKHNAEDTIKKRFRDIYFARSQEEVLDIPDWLFEDIDIPMTPYQEKIYTGAKKDLVVRLQNESSTQIVNINNHLSLAIRLIQAASNPVLIGGTKSSSGKWEALPELLKLYPPPYIIWTSFITTAKMMAEILPGLGLKTDFMLGETHPALRQQIVDMFQGGKLDAIVLGQQVGSFGLTLTKARTAIYLERNFDGSYFQSLHRFRRIGTTQSPVVLHLRSIRKDGGNTIDHVVHNILDYRVNMIQSLTVGMLRDI